MVTPCEVFPGFTKTKTSISPDFGVVNGFLTYSGERRDLKLFRKNGISGQHTWVVSAVYDGNDTIWKYSSKYGTVRLAVADNRPVLALCEKGKNGKVFAVRQIFTSDGDTLEHEVLIRKEAASYLGRKCILSEQEKDTHRQQHEHQLRVQSQYDTEDRESLMERTALIVRTKRGPRQAVPVTGKEWKRLKNRQRVVLCVAYANGKAVKPYQTALVSRTRKGVHLINKNKYRAA